MHTNIRYNNNNIINSINNINTTELKLNLTPVQKQTKNIKP